MHSCQIDRAAQILSNSILCIGCSDCSCRRCTADSSGSIEKKLRVSPLSSCKIPPIQALRPSGQEYGLSRFPSTQISSLEYSQLQLAEETAVQIDSRARFDSKLQHSRVSSLNRVPQLKTAKGTRPQSPSSTNSLAMTPRRRSWRSWKPLEEVRKVGFLKTPIRSSTKSLSPTASTTSKVRRFESSIFASLALSTSPRESRKVPFSTESSSLPPSCC